MSERSDCVLIRLPEDQAEYYRYSESLGLGYIAAFLRQRGFRVEILDGTIDELNLDEMVARTLAAAPLLVGFSVMFNGYTAAKTVARRLRQSGYVGHMTMGQHFATFNAQRILVDVPEIDTVVRFEGEETALELLEALRTRRPLDGILGVSYRRSDGCVVHNSPRPLMSDLNLLPFPARDVLARNRDRVTTINISASRGCPWRCKFCTIATFYRIPKGQIWRYRAPRNVVDEMQQIVERYGSRPFFFVDDQFMGAGKRGREFARALAAELVERGLRISFGIETRADTVDRDSFEALKRAGLELVFVGVESGYQPTLDFYQKDITVAENLNAIKLLQELDLDIQMGFIMFHEGTTLQEVRANLHFLEQANAFDAIPFFNELKIHAGSQFMTEAPGECATEDYQKSWDIADPRARRYRQHLETVLLPLIVPAHMLRVDRRFLTKLPRSVCRQLEQRLRASFLRIATRLLEAAEDAEVPEDLLKQLKTSSEIEAAQLELAIGISALPDSLRTKAPGKNHDGTFGPSLDQDTEARRSPGRIGAGAAVSHIPGAEP